MKIQAWLSPRSDNFPTPKGFPTPRGTHFLEVPVLPSSPSTYSAEDDDESTPASSTEGSNPWNVRDHGPGSRSSIMTDGTEFDDMYDTSDEEDPRPRRQNSSRNSRRSLPRLSIPAGIQPAQDEFKLLTSPVLPTPTLTVTMDASVLEDYMARRTDIDPPTAPPSLDGSLTSEQMAQMSAPPTPVIGSVDGDNGSRQEEWGGVHLQPGALATLQALSGEAGEDDDAAHHLPGPVIEIPQQPQPAQEMESRHHEGLTLITSFTPIRGPGSTVSPLGQRASFAGLTRLDIPSPGGFFSELSPRTRRTWNAGQNVTSPNDVAPPTSTTAEQFYKCPWNAADAPAMPLPPPPPRRPAFQPTFTPILSGVSPDHETAAQMQDAASFRSQSSMSGTLVEQVVEVRSDMDDEGDLPTARRIIGSPTPRAENFPAVVSQSEQTSSTAVDDATEIVIDYDPAYARKQQEDALSNLDRTEMWLMAQNKYLKGIVTTTNPHDENADGAPAVPPKDGVAQMKEAGSPTSTADVAPKKKTVRFSDVITKTDIPCSLPSKLLRHESAYYRAFQSYVLRTQRADVFVHRLPRFEALQAQRVSLPEFHMNQLLGKYQLSVVPQSAKKRLSANVARGDDILVDDPEKLRAEKETEAMSQMAMSMWHVAAMRFLNGGRLLCAPAAKRMARLSTGLSRKEKPRVLDLSGQAVSDWAWHVSLQYPNAKIYTVTTKAIRQMSNCNVRGPPNHRKVAVERMTRLPFPNEHFDLVSARELHSILKYTTQNGEDEWETCLKECMRVLKPGGYIDFAVMDSDIIKAGPMGLAKSVEFGFTLKRLGYDPEPTKLFLGRLRRAGFEDVQRTWMCLPVGARPPSMVTAGAGLPTLKPNPDGSEIKTHKLDAFVTGSSDEIAPVCGLVGSWSWERWLLRCEMEKVSGELRLADTVTTSETIREAGKCLESVHGVIEEGRRCGAGWRMLTGYAKKPKPATAVIQIQLA